MPEDVGSLPSRGIQQIRSLLIIRLSIIKFIIDKEGHNKLCPYIEINNNLIDS
jgi:hypothetical protein